MKKALNKIIAATLSIATIMGLNVIPVSAIEGGYGHFINEDGSYNLEAFEDRIAECADLVKYPDDYDYSQLTEGVDIFHVNNSVFFQYEGDPGIPCYSIGDGNVVEITNYAYLDATYKKDLVYSRFETECTEDGKYYMILDGEKYEFYFADDDNKDDAEHTERFYYDAVPLYTPSTCNPNLFNENGKFKYTITNEDGTETVVNSDGLTYTEMLDISYKFLELQKDKFLFLNEKAMREAYEKGVFGEDIAFEDVPVEDMLKYWIMLNTRKSYKYELGNVTADLDSSGNVDVKDLSMLIKYIIKQKELTPGQEMIASTTGGFKPDIRDVTAVKRYIVKQIDSFE